MGRYCITILLFIIVLLSGCNMKSEEEAIQDTEEIAKKAFASKEEVIANKSLEHLSLYLPDDLEVKEASASNVILKNGDQTYIVFYNKFESADSKLNYQSAKREKALLLETFEGQNMFGYIRILDSKEDKYELQVGIGGVKITTYTEKGTMENDAQHLVNIARSIVETNQDAEKAS